LEIKDERISELDDLNKKMKSLITNYFNEDNINHLDKMERKFNSYNNHINSLLDELLLIKKSDLPIYKFFNKETILQNQNLNLNQSKNQNQIIQQGNEKIKQNQVTNFSNYFKRLNPPKKEKDNNNKTSNNNIEHLKQITTLKNQIESANKILMELISEILFLEYKQEYLSVNFSSINTHLNDNFNIFLNSIFLNNTINNNKNDKNDIKNDNKNTYISNPIISNFSIYHEYLQDIFFKIYQIFLREKMSLNNEGRIPTKDFTFLINEEFLTEDIIDIIVEEVSNENSFFLLVYNTDNDFLPLDEWFDFKIENLLNNNLQKISNLNLNNNGEDEEINNNNVNNSINFDKFVNKNLNNTINNNNFNNSIDLNNISLNNFDLNFIRNNKEEIKDNFTKRLDVLYDRFKYDIKQIIIKARSYLHAGKIVSRNNILYDFSKYYTDYSSIEIKNNEIIYNQLNISKDNIVNFDNLNYNLKYNRNIFRGFYYSMDSRLQGQFITPKNISLANTFTYLFNYSLSSLFTLSIRDYNFNEQSLFNLGKIIENSTNIMNLDLSSNMLGDEGIRIITDSIKLNKSIKSMNISYNNISGNGLLYISEIFLKNNSIEKLFISGNNISGLGMQSLMSTLANNKSIRHLDLSNNKLKNEDIFAVSNFITKNLRFEGINISYNFLDSTTLNQIGLSFKENRTLKFFKGTNLGLNVESTPYLLQHLSNTNIQEIYLDNNFIGATGGILISNVIKSNKKLKIVSLKNCNLNKDSLTCICYSFQQNSNLSNINLELNNFDFDSIEFLCETIADKDITVNLSKSHIESQVLERIKRIQNIILN
jgi:hypothetical protein